MPYFSRRSLKRLATCDERLQEICNEVIEIFDCMVIQGHRDRETHEEYLKKGTTTIPYEKSKHSKNPSLAVDLAPCPLNWSDKGSFYILAGLMFGVARTKGVKLRWGGDWDGDWQRNDQNFDDLPHFQIIE